MGSIMLSLEVGGDDELWNGDDKLFHWGRYVETLKNCDQICISSSGKFT